jgi:hypothetical protein
MGRKTNQRKLYPAIAIIGEGITESIYFTQLRQQEDIQFTVKPDYGKNSGVESIVEKALELLGREYDIVFCVIDMDEMVRNKTLMIKYENLKKKQGNNQLVFIENNPSIEFWFLLHYIFTTKTFQNYKQLAIMLKKYLPAYDKTEKYLSGSNIYNQLKPHQANARNNAEKTSMDKMNKSYSEIYKILNYLGI